jgi:hypothetical protein
MWKGKCAVLAFVVMAFTSVLIIGPAMAEESEKDVENKVDSKKCIDAIASCAKAAVGPAQAIADTIRECKALRQCKKECRQEKRDCKKEARGEKKECKEECRDKFGTGKDYRDCADNCRDDKKEAKGECKEEKEVCKDTCLGTYKTPECEAARKVMLPTIGACAQAIACTVKLAVEAGGE